MNLPKTHRIYTPRCILRCPNKEDIAHIFSATRFKGFNDGMLWDAPKSIEELYEPLQRNLQAWDSASAYSFTIDSVNTNVFIGRVVIVKNKEVDGVWKIGYWIHPERQGQGYMTEVVAAILEFGFTVLGAKRIEAFHAVWNTASEKVLKKNNFKFVRHIPQGFIKHGEWVKENLLAIERTDWNSKNDKNKS